MTPHHTATETRFSSVTQEPRNFVAWKLRVLESAPFLVTRTSNQPRLASNFANRRRTFFVAPWKPLSSFFV